MKHIIGADISKLSIDICIKHNGEHHTKIQNNQKGFSALEQWLEQKHIDNPHIVCEATGKYYRAFAEYFHNKGHSVSVINPYQINKYGESQLRRTKTDKQDAKLILEYAESARTNNRLHEWLPDSESHKRISAYHSLIAQLQTALTAEKNRIQEADPEIKPYHQSNIDHLKDQIKHADGQIKTIIKQNEELNKNNKLLQTMPGIGQKTAPILLNYLTGSIPFKTANQFVAYCGLSPSQFQSGTSIDKKKKSRFGKKDLKTALYMPAMKAYSMNIFSSFVNRLRKKGKSPMTIIIAIMRKLAVIAFHIVKTGKPFDASRYINEA